MESDSAFCDGPALWVNGKEVLHSDGADTYDVRLTRQLIGEMRPRLRADQRIRLRPSTSSDWIEVVLEADSDESLLVELAALAVAAHLPSPGTPMTAPPTGKDLARRRRFH